MRALAFYFLCEDKVRSLALYLSAQNSGFSLCYLILRYGRLFDMAARKKGKRHSTDYYSLRVEDDNAWRKNSVVFEFSSKDDKSGEKLDTSEKKLGQQHAHIVSWMTKLAKNWADFAIPIDK